MFLYLYFYSMCFYLFFLFIFLSFNSWEFLYWLFLQMSIKNDTVILLGDNQNFLNLSLDLFLSLSFIFLMPYFLFMFYTFFSSFWKKKENYNYLISTFISYYLYIMLLWVFLEDLGFSLWELFDKISLKNNKMYQLLDYQPQFENVLLTLYGEFFDLFYFFIFIFFFMMFVMMKFEMKYLKSLRFFILFLYLSCILFFWNFFFFMYSLIIFEFFMLTVYMFFLFKLKK